jgi:hypothetical protein
MATAMISGLPGVPSLGAGSKDKRYSVAAAVESWQIGGYEESGLRCFFFFRLHRKRFGRERGQATGKFAFHLCSAVSPSVPDLSKVRMNLSRGPGYASVLLPGALPLALVAGEDHLALGAAER